MTQSNLCHLIRRSHLVIKKTMAEEIQNRGRKAGEKDNGAKRRSIEYEGNSSINSLSDMTLYDPVIKQAIPGLNSLLINLIRQLNLEVVDRGKMIYRKGNEGVVRVIK